MLHSEFRLPPKGPGVVFIAPKASAAVAGPAPWDMVFSSSLLDASPCIPLKADFSPPSASRLAEENFSLFPEGSPKSLWGKPPKRLDRHSRAASECQMSPCLAG